MQTNEVNVAPTSQKGHFVKGADQVIILDEITETFDVIGKSILFTENHETINLNEDCTIICQQVVNPFTQKFVLSED